MDRIRLLRESTGCRRFTICGTRFGNEVAAIRERGGEIWWIERPGVTAGDHLSDQILTADQCDRVIENLGTVEDLRRQIEAAWSDYAAGRAQLNARIE
jgi:hypothetical protein